MMLLKCTGVLLLLGLCHAQFFNFFGQQQQQQQQPPQYEDTFLNNQCSQYLCPDTQACVASAKECPCPFPKSQLRCPLAADQFVCISKPATSDAKLIQLYDDLENGPKAAVKGMRDCGWVLEAYRGLV